jgi:protocatechuate 3,4-dioxygenase beta subunit
MRNPSFIAIIFVLLFVSQGYIRSACLAQTQKEAGTITGHVKLEGKPAPDITIIATPSVTDPAKIVEQMFNSSASIKARTDSEGVYRLEGVPPGKYHLAASAPALIGVDSNSAGEITVAEDSVIEGVDFALSFGGVITGKITDSEGRPVIGERVSLKPLEKGEDPTAMAAATQMFGNRMYSTDDRGVYRIYGLRPGRYIVGAGKDSDVMSAFLSQRPKRVQTYYPSVTDESRARPVQVTAGSEASGVDIQFSATDKGFIVSGRVIDSENKTPIANAMVAYSKGQTKVLDGDKIVTVDEDADEHEIDSSGMPGGFTTTNDKGEFRFASVSPGKYKLEATAIGAFAGTSGSQFYADPVAFEVQSSNVEKVDVKVHRGASINGIVVVEGANTQDGLDRFGQFMLTAMVANDATKSYSSGTCVVAADGSFRLGGLKPGKVTLRPVLMGARRVGLLRVERYGAEVQGGFELQANEEVSGIRVIVVPATCVIRGRATIQGGTLQPGAKITAIARSVGRDPSDSPGIIGNPPVEVGPNGSFVIENLTPGTYEVEVFTFPPSQQGPRRVHATQTVVVTPEIPGAVDLVLDLSGKSSDK